MTDTVLYEREGRIATITYNRPEALNAINQELREDLNAAWVRFRDDDEAWVAIITGAGRAFSAGADLRGGARPQGHEPLGNAEHDLARVRSRGVEADDRGGERLRPGIRPDDGRRLRLRDRE